MRKGNIELGLTPPRPPLFEKRWGVCDKINSKKGHYQIEYHIEKIIFFNTQPLFFQREGRGIAGGEFKVPVNKNKLKID